VLNQEIPFLRIGIPLCVGILSGCWVKPETSFLLVSSFLVVSGFFFSLFFNRQITNLIYGYGRTEDIPYGGLIRVTAGREFNEFKTRTYLGTDLSAGKSFPDFGYIYSSLALASFINGNEREQGIFYTKLNYFSNLLSVGRYRLRNFINLDYSRGFGRYSDETIWRRFPPPVGIVQRSQALKGVWAEP